jgi:predicted lipoprotein with Yx(FWY)xxD motif
MRYRRWTPAVLAIPALLLAACGSSTAPSSASGSNNSSSMSTKSSSSGMSGTGKSKSGSSGMMSSSTATLMKVKTRIGPVLADSKGFTLYWYAKDTAMASACTGGCATAWPPVTGKPAAAMGVRLTGKFGTITRSGGIVQATYKGHPLYTYAGDTSPGQVKGNGLGGVWHALRVNAINAVSANSLMMGAGSSPSPKASASKSSGSGSGSGGGGY